MTAEIDVTLFAAIWTEPRVFAGQFAIETKSSTGSTRYSFRAESPSPGDYRFTSLRKLERSSQKQLLALGLCAVEVLTVALHKSVALLQARDVARFADGRGPSSVSCSLEDLGFQVRFPFTPAGEDAVAALEELTRTSEESESLGEA
jgi:hypothetical protein